MIDATRFWRFCMLLDDSPDSCWIWTGAVNEVDATGRFWVTADKEIRAHRAAYELRYGEPPPKGYRLVKTCAHPQCVRHWKLGGPFRKVSVSDRSAFRPGYLSLSMVARKFGVTRRYAAKIRAGFART